MSPQYVFILKLLCPDLKLHGIQCCVQQCSSSCGHATMFFQLYQLHVSQESDMYLQAYTID